MQSALRKAALLGLVLTAGLGVIPYRYCVCGNGFGLPMAMVCPHKESSFVIELFSQGETLWFLDFRAIFLDFMIISGLVFAADFAIAMLRNAFLRT